MQVRSITVNAASLAPKWGIQGDMPQVQSEKNGLGPECRVTISREGKALSYQQTAQQAEKHAQGTQNAEAGKTLTSQQEEYVGLKKSIADMYKEMGYYGDELRERTESLYEAFCQGNGPSHGGIKQVPIVELTDEEKAAMNERARVSKENMEKILKSLTPADFANATPLHFDHVTQLSDIPENESW